MCHHFTFFLSLCSHLFLIRRTIKLCVWAKLSRLPLRQFHQVFSPSRQQIKCILFSPETEQSQCKRYASFDNSSKFNSNYIQCTWAAEAIPNTAPILSERKTKTQFTKKSFYDRFESDSIRFIFDYLIVWLNNKQIFPRLFLSSIVTRFTQKFVCTSVSRQWLSNKRISSHCIASRLTVDV